MNLFPTELVTKLKPFTYQVITYFSTNLPIYTRDLFPTQLVTKVKPNINSVEVHPQLSKNNEHPVDGALVGAGSCKASKCDFNQFKGFFMEKWFQFAKF